MSRSRVRGLQVDVVGAGGRHQDQPEVGAGGEGGGVQVHLVGDRHARALQALGHFVGGSGRMQLQFIEAAAQAAQVEVAQVQGAVVEEYSAAQGHGAGSWGVV